MRKTAVQWTGPLVTSSSSSSSTTAVCEAGSVMSDIASSPAAPRALLRPFETPSTQLARFTLASSSRYYLVSSFVCVLTMM